MPHHFPALFLFTHRTNCVPYYAMSYENNLTLERLTCRCHELLETQSPHTPTNVQSLEAVGSFRTIEADTGDNEPLVAAAKELARFLAPINTANFLTNMQEARLRGLLAKLEVLP